MRLTINGEPREVADALTIAQLIVHLSLAGRVAVEVNREIVPRARHEEHVLVEGDTLEIVHFVGGG
jgi:sulfur carrier protein